MTPRRVLYDQFEADYALLDPGAGGVIAIDRWGAVCNVVTTGAEARTLRQPQRAAIQCMIVLDTDGGDLTLTVTGGYDQAGSTTITFADAGDVAVFVSIKVGSSYYWRLVASEGVSGTSQEFGNIDVDNLTVDGWVSVAGILAVSGITSLSQQTIDMAGATVTLTSASLTGSLLFVDANTLSAPENLVLPPEATSSGIILIIVNTGGEQIVVQDDTPATVITLETAEAGIVVCDGSTWYGFMGAIT